MDVVLDTSAWIKLYFNEPGSQTVADLVAKAKSIGVSQVAIPELFSMLRRAVREHALTEVQYQQAKAAVLDDLASMAVFGLDAAVVQEAVACLEKAVLQGCDSIHVASAKVNKRGLFVTADFQQGKAAQSLGMTVELIK
jgi:predicted nucleic acid-binding protein